MPRLSIIFLAATAAAATGFSAQAHDLTASPLAGPPGPDAPQAHARGFAGPEAVYVPLGRDYAIVSNTNGNFGPPRPDSEPGFLSKLGLNGRVQEMHWVQDERMRGLTGMRSFGDTLYVANGTSIIAVDMNAGEMTGLYECPDAGFINDIATGPDGTVYGSDTTGAGIFTVPAGGGECTWFIERTATPGAPPNPGNPLQTINGLYGADDALMAVTIPGRVLSIDYDSGEVTVLAEDVGSLDGIEPYGDRNGSEGWLISDTRGKIIHFHEGDVQVLVDSSSAGIGGNDMGYDPESGTALLARLSFDMISLYSIRKADE